MDTGILHLSGRSCHDNKSQRVDPFIVLSRIIAGKTKYVKDPFSPRIHSEARLGKACALFYGFWEKWGNARTDRIGPKGNGEDALREF